MGIYEVDEEGYPLVDINVIPREDIFKAWDEFDKNNAKQSRGVKTLTAEELYSTHMKKRPDVLRLELSLNLDYLSSEEFAVLHRYGKVEKGIIREVLVPANITLHALNYVILKCFGWQNSHLHHFNIPAQVFQEMTGGKNEVNKMGHCEYDGLYSEWVKYCGMYFRFPCDDYEDLYWDDDYEDGQNIDTWFRHKYTGPYWYNGTWEHYHFAHEAAKRVIDNNPVIRKAVSFSEWERLKAEGKDPSKIKPEMIPIKKASIWEIGQGFEGRMDELIERLPLMEVLYPVHTRRDESIGSRLEFLAKRQEKEEDEIPVIPVADELKYEYDYGDGWEVTIKMTDCYYVMNRYDIVHIAGLKGGYAFIDDEHHLKEDRVYDMNNQRIEDDLAMMIKKVEMKEKPECISADGLNVMDDVGGIYGYIRFLEAIHGSDPEEIEETKKWARFMGWTGRMRKAEKML